MWKIISTLICEQLPIYYGKTIYYKATKEDKSPFNEDLRSLMNEDKIIRSRHLAQTTQQLLFKMFSESNPNFEVKEIAAGHFSMLDDEFCDIYINDLDLLI